MGPQLFRFLVCPQNRRRPCLFLGAPLKNRRLLRPAGPAAALDPKTAATVLRLTDEFIKRDNLTALMVTHNMKDALAYGNRIIMMNEGRILFDIEGEEKKNLTVEELLKRFQSAQGDALVNDRMLLS